ncbi:hypothetical protein FVEG_07476 [Fusarium verticillioides 7600]|uniref:Uncharacterized protein n=1 Tax=Gibberella moniliformis (strain M3125 / FGSC 7600) TaxID=334819 RepID=W7MID7_GIBM7|nr:hypothetical protein FVEG_07476 [Fusarium verticillioides 7600]EWG47345.1 hypothetical protein FVEG_07476 [Fusarium verticillioides 7600]
MEPMLCIYQRAQEPFGTCINHILHNNQSSQSKRIHLSLNTSHIMSTKNPSHGQKVDLGQNAPVKEEGAGTVPNESLAAESLKEGGEFASNEGIHGENQPTSRSENASAGHNTNTSSAPSSGSDSKSSSSAPKSSGTASKSGDSAPKSLAGTAPSYVENQYIKESGPHGKNLKEGIDYSNTKDGLKKALESEPGSQDDPSRLAEQQFQQNQTAAGRDAGPKQSELEGKTAFDALNNEASS